MNPCNAPTRLRLLAGGLIFCLLVLPASAKHIIGGVLTYECLGGGTYRFVLKMYRDCSDPTGAYFDYEAAVSIYKGDELLETKYPGPDIVNDLEPEVDNPCVNIPSSICVQEGIYSFLYTFADWPSDEPYTISYQRCCRNNSISNITTPGDVGATFTITLTPEAQAVCNSSPFFQDLPPIVICNGEPLVVNHSAFDPDGDQLVYALCAPLAGGGNNTSGNGCNSVIPDPACPPPYEPVNFLPPYTPLDPMGGDPPLQLDPQTGMLTGTPTTFGQFVVGVCVSEYRDGVLLSTIRRDFQFNVVNCTPTVAAQVAADTLIGDTFLIEQCLDPVVQFTNQSVQQGLIDEYRWEFFGESDTIVSTTWHPELTFPGPGTWPGWLLLNPGAECSDTALLQVRIYAGPDPDFSFAYDTCRAGPVLFFDHSTAVEAPIVAREWRFGDGTLSDATQPAHVYQAPGHYNVILTTTDDNGCVAQRIRQVRYQPAPAILIVAPDDTLSCPPAAIAFDLLSAPVDETYKVMWDFGDGGSDTSLQPVHTYTLPGTYDLALSVTSPIGCHIDTVFPALIRIEEPVQAAFDYSPHAISGLHPEVVFSSLSANAARLDWYDDGLFIGQGEMLDYVFPDTGLHRIELVATHAFGCTDTARQWLDVAPEYTFFMPNAFTPNHDARNEGFGPGGIWTGLTDYRLEVYDRWGQRVFVGSSPRERWNGRLHNTGPDLPAGTYVWQVRFRAPRGDYVLHKGFVTLFR